MKYELLIDLPGVKCGTKIEPLSALAYGYVNKGVVHFEWSNDFVQTHPQWFRKIEEESGCCSPVSVIVAGVEFVHPDILKKARLDAFFASRELTKGVMTGYMGRGLKYETFESYLQSLK